eukprot:scaffold85787_cov21-Tisochrysis_lutea.AAC.3
MDRALAAMSSKVEELRAGEVAITVWALSRLRCVFVCPITVWGLGKLRCVCMYGRLAGSGVSAFSRASVVSVGGSVGMVIRVWLCVPSSVRSSECCDSIGFVEDCPGCGVASKFTTALDRCPTADQQLLSTMIIPSLTGHHLTLNEYPTADHHSTLNNDHLALNRCLTAEHQSHRSPVPALALLSGIPKGIIRKPTDQFLS